MPLTVTTMLDLRLHNLRSSVPLHQGDWGYLDTAKIRPIAAYLNAKPSVLDLSTTVTVDLVRAAPYCHARARTHGGPQPGDGTADPRSRARSRRWGARTADRL